MKRSSINFRHDQICVVFGKYVPRPASFVGRWPCPSDRKWERRGTIALFEGPSRLKMRITRSHVVPAVLSSSRPVGRPPSAVRRARTPRPCTTERPAAKLACGQSWQSSTTTSSTLRTCQPIFWLPRSDPRVVPVGCRAPAQRSLVTHRRHHPRNACCPVLHQSSEYCLTKPPCCAAFFSHKFVPECFPL